MLPNDSEGTVSGSTDAGSEPNDMENVPDVDAVEGAEQNQDPGADLAPPGVSVLVPPTLPPQAPVPPADRVRWEYRCKICQLAIKLPTIYQKLHDLILKDKRSYNSSVAEVNAYIAQHRLRVHPLNMPNILTHFKKHIGIETQVQLAISRQNMTPVVPTQAQVAQQVLQPTVIDAVGDEVDDFNNLNELRVRITNVLRRLELQLDVMDPATQQVRLDKFAVQSFVALTAETRACIQDLNKMRQSERLLNTVAQTLLDRLTFAIIPQLMEEYKVVTQELAEQGVSPEIVQRVDFRLRTKMSEIITNTARGAILEIRRQFKLK